MVTAVHAEIGAGSGKLNANRLNPLVSSAHGKPNLDLGEENVALLISYPDGQSTLSNNAGALPSLTANAKRNFYQPVKNKP